SYSHWTGKDYRNAAYSRTNGGASASPSSTTGCRCSCSASTRTAWTLYHPDPELHARRYRPGGANRSEFEPLSPPCISQWPRNVRVSDGWKFRPLDARGANPLVYEIRG